MSPPPRALVAGIGNVFLSDDGFGVEVARRLAGRPIPEDARVEDFGIRGIHLAYELLEGYDTLVLVDAVPMGEAAGTLALIEPEGPPGAGDPVTPAVDAHTMSPDVVLATLSRLGGAIRRVLVVGCQPAVLDEGMGLSPAVAAAVGPAADLCLDVLARTTEPIERGIHR